MTDMVVCNYCSGSALLVSGRIVYPHRSDLRKRKFYFCEPCDAYVGCHQGTTKPLGTLANKDLRKERSEAHFMFDQLWKFDYMQRKEAYKWLAEKMNISVDDCHIGMFNIEQCRQVIELVRDELKREGVNIW